MKKLLVFILILACIGSTSFLKFERTPFFEVAEIEKVCFVSNEKFEKEQFDSVQCGDYIFNFCDASVAKQKFKELKNVKSVQFYYKNITVEQLFLKLDVDVVSENALENLVVYNCYTPYFDDFIYLENKKVNMQVVTSNGFIVAGFPVIMTGY